MFCMSCYRGLRELCFYCRFGMIQNAIYLGIMLTFYLKTFPWFYFVSVAIIFFIAIVLKGVQKKKENKVKVD